MAMGFSLLDLSSQWLLLIGLLVRFCSAAPECPDYVADYAPLVWLHSDDPFKPSDLLAHVQHSTPMLGTKAINDTEALDLDNLDILDKRGGDKVALTSKDDPLSRPQWLMGEAPDENGRIRNSTPCVVILVQKTKAELDAFYFYFYSYNEGPNITQVLEPLNRLVAGKEAESGMHFGNHVGDWEHNMIRFRDGKPVGIYYSQHESGQAFEWDDAELSKRGERPVVYSARGSHANYVSAGDQVRNAVLIDYCDEGQTWDPVLSAYFYRYHPATGVLTSITPPKDTSPTPKSNMTSFFFFTGMWGDFEYPNSDPRQKSIPRFGLKRFLSGPKGPRDKQLVRKGLLPDHFKPISWLEYAVTVFMAWYPCCIRGWRKWISVGVFVVILSGLVLGAIFCFRRRRKGTAYTRLQEEEIPLDEWEFDETRLTDEEDEERETHR